MKVSLQLLFNSRKEELSDKLEGMYLPKDSDAIYQIVYDYFNKAFDSDSEFRQNLTQSEDYILQAAIPLLYAHNEMTSSMKIERGNTFEGPDNERHEFKPLNPSTRYCIGAVVGSGVGAVVGKLAFGGWGTVLGAIVGTAIAIHVTSNKKQPTFERNTIDKQKKQPFSPLNVEAFISTISSICASVDNLLDTFRAQINNVVQKYESKNKFPLISDYLPLMGSIQTLVGYERTHSADDNKYAKKLKERIEDVSEVLDTWDIRFVDYDGNNSNLFERIPSEKATTEKMIYPAIVKGSELVSKGKIFIPQD